MTERALRQQLTDHAHWTAPFLQLDGKPLGIRIDIPAELHQQKPFNATAYTYLHALREAIHQHGIVWLPHLPVNKTNHTLAQRSPHQHGYSSNHYLTDICQAPHQDTPPHPTAFWLGETRRFSATWVMGEAGAQRYYHFAQQQPHLSVEQIHRQLVPDSLQNGWGLLINQQPGLILIDNSQHARLYHARTCHFAAVDALPAGSTAHHADTPMYAYNVVGLLHYIDQLDERRGTAHRDPVETAAIRQRLAN